MYWRPDISTARCSGNTNRVNVPLLSPKNAPVSRRRPPLPGSTHPSIPGPARGTGSGPAVDRAGPPAVDRAGERLPGQPRRGEREVSGPSVGRVPEGLAALGWGP
ncbi:hypothetical protein GCM10009714_28430 [Microlunatus capsulatus]